MECCKNKTKVFTWPIKKNGDQPVNQSKLKVITRSRHKARENLHVRATIGFGNPEPGLSLSSPPDDKGGEGL